MSITEAIVLSIAIICVTIVALTKLVFMYDKDFLKEDKKKNKK